MANMHAAYKKEKKKKEVKRRTPTCSSLKDGQFGGFPPPHKKLKDDVCECFPLVATEQGSAAKPTPS